jgi:chromosome condensin MukBEF ATPase and DNA-binding subunit MukB
MLKFNLFCSHLETRRQHGIEQAQVRKRLSEARAMGEDEEVQGLKERLKEIQAGIDFTQDGIEETQQAIMQLEDTRVIFSWNHSANIFTVF